MLEPLPDPPGKPYLILRPRSGWAAINLRELWRYRDLLYVLASRDVTLRYRQTLLGVAWVVLQPLLAAGIFTFVFGLVAKLPSGGVPYFLFSYVGMLAWTAFQGTLTRASTSLVQNAHLVSKVYFPRLILPLSAAAATGIDFVVGLALLAFLLPLYHIAPGFELLLLPVWFLLIMLLAVGLGLFAAALMVQYRDVQYVLPILIQFGMYASPVAYGLAVVPERFATAYLLNPMASLLEGFRWSLLGGAAPPAWGVLYATVFSTAAFFVGAFAFRRMERRFADVI